MKTPSILARSTLEGKLQLQINHIANVKGTCHWKLPGKDGESFYYFFLGKKSELLLVFTDNISGGSSAQIYWMLHTHSQVEQQPEAQIHD